MINFASTNLVPCSDFLDKKFDQFADFLDRHPTSYKVVLVASHIFRSAAMFTMMQCLPLPLPISYGLLLLPSLLYRSAIERFCNFRFTLPSLAGALSMSLGRTAAISLMSKTAFSSIGACFSTGIGILSLSSYLVFICLRSSADIEKRMEKLKSNCCCT